MREILYLIDGTALLYRSHYAMINNPMRDTQGRVTSAIFGVVNSFVHLLETRQVRNVLISFDRKAPTFRHEISETYKANRPPMPDDLVAQIEPVQEFFRLIELPEISLDGYEADDILATLAERYKSDYDIVFVTSDKDYSQLVEDRVSILDPGKNLVLDRDAVHARFGVYPEQFVDYLALVGDSSDNIPGVRGIGPKSAEILFQQFDSLEDIYARLDEAPEKLRKKLAEGRESALLSRQLAQIVRDVPLSFPSPQELSFSPANLSGALDFLASYDIHHLKRRIENRFKDQFPAAEENMVQGDIFAGEPQAEPETPQPARAQA